MKWTDAPPTALGWYWVRNGSVDLYKPVNVVMANYLGRDELWVKDDTEMRPLDVYRIEGAEWAGPIEQPEEE